MLLFAPQVILYSQGSLGRWRPAQMIEAAAVFLAVLLVGLLVFCGFPTEMRGYPLEFLCVPVLTWAAFRLGRREAALALLVLEDPGDLRHAQRLRPVRPIDADRLADHRAALHRHHCHDDAVTRPRWRLSIRSPKRSCASWSSPTR
jgi:hypothetical protein